jgi:hypothetical protein
MPRDRSMILSDLRGATLAIVREPCGRLAAPPFDEGKFRKIGATYVLFPRVNCCKDVIARLG